MGEELVREIAIPENVSVEVDKGLVRVRGPKGSVEKDFSNPKFADTIAIEKGPGVKVISKSGKRKFRAVAGTIESCISSMFRGVTAGYKYVMKVSYSHFPVSVSVKGDEVQIKNFLGEKGARTAKITGNCNVAVEKDEIVITGINIEDVGQTAANIEQACKITKRDRRIFQDGIFVVGKYLQNGEKI